VATEPRRVPPPRGSRRAGLRRMALRLGAALGWSPDEVMAFTGALTGAPWARCDDAGLALVVRALRALRALRPPASSGAVHRGPRGPRPPHPATGAGGAQGGGDAGGAPPLA
jgi:hypothetical protein